MPPDYIFPPGVPRFIRENPLHLLLPYQIDWAYDPSRWKFGLMARQVGKDHASAEEGIRDCLLFEADKKKTTWLIAAPSERQSLESLAKWKEWAAQYQLEVDEYRRSPRQRRPIPSQIRHHHLSPRLPRHRRPRPPRHRPRLQRKHIIDRVRLL